MAVDLNYPISGKTIGELYRFFDCKIELIRAAINSGAKTYQDVYDYIQKHGKRFA